MLKNQLEKYYLFVQKMVTENEVLDKKFYLVIPFSSLELGISSTLSSSFKKKSGLPFEKFIIQKAQAALIPKRDHLISQLTRLGLQTKQLTTRKLLNCCLNTTIPTRAALILTKIRITPLRLFKPPLVKSPSQTMKFNFGSKPVVKPETKPAETPRSKLESQFGQGITSVQDIIAPRRHWGGF